MNSQMQSQIFFNRHILLFSELLFVSMGADFDANF